MEYQFAVVGLAVMGSGLALNLAEHGFSVAGYNLEPENTAAFVCAGLNAGYQVAGFSSYQALCAALERPRKILVMVRAGDPVDLVLEGLLPHLEREDIVIDGGNSQYQDTARRCAHAAKFGVHVLGMGVSGGAEGARHGPALMPGGDKSAYEQVAPFLTAIAAHVGGAPCCAYIGPQGAGHFVKTVHNGIEYGDMQLICEAYYLMKRLLGYSAPQIAQIFRTWNEGELSSYLIEITAHVLSVIDPETDTPLVDRILGAAGSKGTGMWASQEALSLGVPLPTISQAVFSRYLSTLTQERKRAAAHFACCAPAWQGKAEELLEQIRQGLYASKMISYAQGFSLLSAANHAHRWNLNLRDISLLFRGGCIIRAAFLEKIAQAFDCASPPASLLLDEYFSAVLLRYQGSWRQVVAAAATHGISTPGFASALCYFDGYRDSEGPLNLLQAQRDFFGAHMFRRDDREGTFHGVWL